MTPQDTLVEMLARVGTGDEIYMSERELGRWPTDTVDALKAQKLIRKAPPAISVVCPGCEEHCTMPVETIPPATSAPATFVVCDKRDDTNRVAISGDQLVQWRTSSIAVGRFVAKNLSIRWRGIPLPDNGFEIGMMKATRKSQMLCLRSKIGLVLVAGTSELPLVEAIMFTKGRFMLDVRLVEQLVNNSTTSDSRYTPGEAKREARKIDTRARHERWRKEYRRRRKENPDKSDSWCAIQISRMGIGEGKSADTIRKNMK